MLENEVGTAPYVNLGEAIICRAVKDFFHKNARIKKGAEKFFNSKDFEWYCSTLGLDSRKIHNQACQLEKRLSATELEIGQYDKNGDLIATHLSLADAERATGVMKSNLIKALIGVRQSAGGFVWRHVS